MADYIEYSTIEQIVYGIADYLKTSDKKYLLNIQEEMKLAKEIDGSIMTKSEYSNNGQFIAASHSPSRLAVFLLNYFGEHYLDRGELTIKSDDPSDRYTNTHDNTYRLVLKDIDTHERLYKGNPTAEDDPYDFNSEFIRQITHYPNNTVDTTATSWESFAHEPKFRPGYFTPKRTFDFKSALWKSGGEHKVNYILKLDFDRKLKLFNRLSKVEKSFKFTAASGVSTFYDKYFQVLDIIKLFNNYQITWADCIISNED